MTRLILCFVLLSSGLLSAQRHYDWFKIKKYRVATLETRIKENSSLNFYHGKLYTLNDGGNPSFLYELDPATGKVTQSHELTITNRDWEGLSSNSNHFYIGDFGNNAGDRKDLKIYQINAQNYALEKEFPFTIPEQTDLSPKLNGHDFDVESLVLIDTTFHLFTKQWKSQKVAHYTVDQNLPQVQKAHLLETFDLGFMATDAEYHNEKLYLVGYTKRMEVFLSIFERDQNGTFFSKAPKKYFLGLSSSIGQIESLAIANGMVYLSGEEFAFQFIKSPAALYAFPLEKLK